MKVPAAVILNERQIEELIRVHLLAIKRERSTEYRREACRETVAALRELLALRKAAAIPVRGVCV